MEQLIRILQGDFKTGKCVIRCETEELANEFLNICEDNGYKCRSGFKLSSKSWDNYRKDTCYYNSEYGMEYCEADYYKHIFITILNFTGFKTKLSDKETLMNATITLNTYPPTTTTKETIEVIYHKRETIVLLKSGGKHYKGVVKCHVNDTYNKEQGFVLAYNIARDNQERGKY